MDSGAQLHDALPIYSIQKIPVESMTAVSSMRVRAAHGNSFNHLVGAGEHGRRHVEPERLGGLEVEHRFVLGRRLPRNSIRKPFGINGVLVSWIRVRSYTTHYRSTPSRKSL